MAHTRKCALSLRDPSTCRCECDGSLHGTAWMLNTQDGPEAQYGLPRHAKVRSRQRKVRHIALGATLTASLAIGGLTITATFDTPASGASHLSAQVNVDLSTKVNVDLQGIATALSARGFDVTDASKPGMSGFLSSADCAASATGLVAQFFTLHPCEQYIEETWKITRQGITTFTAFSWVDMSSAALASQYKAVVDIYGTGNPPGISSAFNGLCYASDRQGSMVGTVEVETTGQAGVDQEILRDAAGMDLSEQYLRAHCIK